MFYPFFANVCRTDGRLPFDEARFLVMLYGLWDDEAREAFDALLRAWKSACYLGGFSGDLLRRAWEAKEVALREDGRAERLPPLVVGGWSGPDYRDGRVGDQGGPERGIVTWQASHFGAGEAAVKALLDMLWFYHLTVRKVYWVEVG